MIKSERVGAAMQAVGVELPAPVDAPMYALIAFTRLGLELGHVDYHDGKISINGDHCLAFPHDKAKDVMIALNKRLAEEGRQTVIRIRPVPHKA